MAGIVQRGRLVAAQRQGICEPISGRKCAGHRSVVEAAHGLAGLDSACATESVGARVRSTKKMVRWPP